MPWQFLPFVASSLGGLAALWFAPAASAAEVDFERDVVAVLATRCVECHNAEQSSGGLNLTTHAGLKTGGDSGEIVAAGKPDESSLLERVSAGEMPPESRGQSQKLPDAEIAVLRKWIADGAKWPEGRTIGLYEKTTAVRGGLDWWSLKPVKRPAVPEVKSEGAKDAANPIDAFVVAKLDAAGMSLAPPADRRTLLRRAYVDVLGLPPTPEEIDAFVRDESPRAWENVVDRLLASRHYGERWARHWLDVVRFAETSGYERDQLKPGIWKYRDWVIQALNDDMPYDRFVTLQLAGDEVPDRNESTVIATGMLRAGTWNDEPNDPADYLYERLEDVVHTTSTAFLGLTVKCARCHNHKFDPIPQTDYYRLAACFWPGYLGQANLGGPDAKQLGYDVFGWTDKGRTAEPLHLLEKGDRHRPGREVPPGFLSAVAALDKPIAPPAENAATTGRRLQLAQWLADPQHPLTARVMVNRLWLHHFGEGLVRTSDNFGFKGELPTHPELLDWLAAELMSPSVSFESDANRARPAAWSLKHLHKLMLMSRVYQQASLHPEQAEYAERDAANRLWWRTNRRRLDAESLRDALLATSGRLNLKLGGPSFYPTMSREVLEGLSRKDAAWQASPAEEQTRRSIYMMSKRSLLSPLMTAFDAPDTTLPCSQRDVSSVAPQALALLNNDFVHAQSEALAERVTRDAGGDADRQIAQAWRFAFGRLPSEREMSIARQHLTEQTAHFQKQLAGQAAAIASAEPKLAETDRLALWLRADSGVDVDEQNRVRFWRDVSTKQQADHPNDASQAAAEQRPVFEAKAIGERPAVRFDGDDDFLHVAGQVLASDQFSIFAVVAPAVGNDGHREIISNWHRDGRSTSSVFLGTTAENGLRLSDAFASAGTLVEPERPFVLTGISGAESAATFQNDQQLATTKRLPDRDVRAPYVIGTQGNYGSEWWKGHIAEILVYDRALGERERTVVWDYLAAKYQLKKSPPKRDPARLALASLCHVLLNANEFIYVD